MGALGRAGIGCALRRVVDPRLLEVDGERIDLRGENKIILAEAADGVCPEFDRGVAIAFDVEVGVVAVLFGDAGAFVEESHARHEIFDGPVLADPLAVMGEAPAFELFELGLGLFERVRGDASLAGEALLLAELAGGLGVHRDGFFQDRIHRGESTYGRLSPDSGFSPILALRGQLAARTVN
jgi:hypothetical protein